MSKNKERRAKEKKSAPPLRSTLKNRARHNKGERTVKPALFAGTLFLLLIALSIYAMCYWLAPEHRLTADITTVPGGFDLVYDIETVAVSYFDGLKVGDRLYVSADGLPASNPKNGIYMEVAGIDEDNGIAQLRFAVDDVPKSLTPDELQRLLSEEDSATLVRSVVVIGKVVGGRFIAHTVVPLGES